MREATVVASVCWSPDGGIGRRAGLKHLWETVPVRLRLRVQKPLRKKRLFWFMGFLGINPKTDQVQKGSRDSLLIDVGFYILNVLTVNCFSIYLHFITIYK